jgi:hypothetical protein
MRLTLAKLRAIALLAMVMGMALQAFHRVLWLQFLAGARAIWRMQEAKG